MWISIKMIAQTCTQQNESTAFGLKNEDCIVVQYGLSWVL